jgi:hypothetical protein
LYLLFGLCPIVAVVEGVIGPAAFGRSYRLASPNWLTFLGVMFFVFVISYVVQMMANVVPQVHIRLVVSTIVSSALLAWTNATFVVFYFSCRCAVEYFDLYHLARSIQVEPPTLAEFGGGAGLNYDAT